MNLHAMDSLGFGPVYHYNEVSIRPGEGTNCPRTTLTRVSAKRTLRFEQTRFLAILNDSYVHYKG